MDTVIYMPDGNGGLQAVPEVLLEDELIRFLRLPELNVRNPKNLLRYYRGRGLLKAARIGHRNVYTKAAALAFLQKITRE